MLSNVNYQNVPFDTYQERFTTRCTEIATLLKTMESIFHSKNISLLDLGPRTSWNIFEAIGGLCDHDLSPQKDWETIPFVTHSMTEDICALKETISTVSQQMNEISQCLDQLSCLVSELVPPPAQTDGVDDAALTSEYLLDDPATAA